LRTDSRENLGLGMVVFLAATLVLGAVAAHRPPAAALPTGVRQAGDMPFWTDPGVPEVLRANGLQVTQNYMGSRAVAQDPKLRTYDIASVSSDDAAVNVQQQLTSVGIADSTRRIPMGTVMIVFTHRPIAQLLQQIGIASRGPDGVWYFDMHKYVEIVLDKKMRWDEIKGNTEHSNSNQILLATTDPSESGSGELFLMILSYVLNGDATVTDKATANRLLPHIVPFYQDQGDLLIHTPDLLDEFLTAGMDSYPMIFGYEGDYLAKVIDHPGTLPSDLVVMYPKPTIFSENELVSWTPVGDKLNTLLATDPAMIDLEIENGQRASGRAEQFVGAMAKHGATVPAQLVEVRAPSDTIVEYMIDRIRRARQQAGSG
jgi:hypothetical protein